MMGAAEREKGVQGEMEAAAILRAHTGWNVRRRARQGRGDDDLEGIPGWSVEVKRHKTASRPDIARWWAQAVSQAGAAWPVLLYRADRGEWRAVWSLAVLGIGAAAPQPAHPFDNTADTSISAWAQVARTVGTNGSRLPVDPPIAPRPSSMANVPCARARAGVASPRRRLAPHRHGAGSPTAFAASLPTDPIT